MMGSVPVPQIDSRDAAVGFLDARIGHGVRPGLERIEGILDFLAEPQGQYPIIHIAGTNGKTTVSRIVDAILGAHGLRTGVFTSPHLHRVEERFQLDGRVVADERFVAAVREIAWVVEEYERRSGELVTYFELTAVLALSLFAEEAVDVAIIEVGMGGRWDASNVVQAAVSAITGISLDHTAHLGDSIGEIAAEKAAILKEDGLLVTGRLPAAAEGAVTAQVAQTGARWIREGADFSVAEAVQAVGGWRATIDGVFSTYDDLYLPLHGSHQVDHLATSIAICEMFLDRPLDQDLIAAASAAVTSPGRLEVAGHQPLVLLDGAHNEEGFRGLAQTLDEEFPRRRWQLVVGIRGDRDVEALLKPLQGLVEAVWATQADDPASVPAEEVAVVAALVLGVEVIAVNTVPEAVTRATAAAGAEGAVVVAGSLYVVGEARSIFIGDDLRPSGVHVRYEVDAGDDADEDEEGFSGEYDPEF